MSSNNLPTPRRPIDLAIPNGQPTDKTLAKLQKEYLHRRAATEAGKRSATDAVEAIVDLNAMVVTEFARGTEEIVNVVEYTGRSPMAQGPIDEYARRRIDRMASETEATVDRAALEIARKATDPYDTTPVKPGLLDKLRGKD